ncbi:MAG: lamin tail domain-containing protein [Fluviicola sp.]
MFKLLLTFSLLLFITSSYAQIVINEVHAKPATSSSAHSDQSLAHTTPLWGREFIEIYNTSCITVDIGCYVLSTESFGTTTRDGSYRFPAGTAIGPHGFLSIGGPISGAGINLSALLVASDPHLATGSSTRWYIDNGDCYVALFDDTGAPVDAVFWTTGSGESNKWAVDSDLDDPVSQIPAPPGCGVISGFADPSDANITAVVEYAGQSPALGSSLARAPDGGAWTNTGTPSPSSTNGVFDPCPLPVQLAYFDADCDKNIPLLTWQTVTETNNDYFAIEYSADGYNFQTLAEIDGAGTTTAPQFYQFRVESIELNQGYFRLRQVDFDGTEDISQLQHTQCQGSSPIVTLIDGQLVVSSQEEILSCTICDISGRIVFQSLDFETFHPNQVQAIYYVSLTTKQGSSVHRVMNL